MKSRTVILILLIVLLPLGLLTWGAVRLASGERAMVQQQFRELMEERLRDINGNISRHFDDIKRTMQRVTEIDDLNVDELRQLNRSEPRVLQVFVLSESGQLLYPDPRLPLNRSEESFLFHTAKMFTGHDLRDAVLRQEGVVEGSYQAANRAGLVPSVRSVPSQQQPGTNRQAEANEHFAASSGWFVWYWDRGLNLIHWQRRSSGRIVGATLERARWMADLIAELPDTSAFAVNASRDQSAAERNESIASRIRLVNSAGDPVYQWGSFEIGDNAQPFCEIPVTEPLSSWRLQCYVPEQQLAVTGRSAYASLVGGLIAVALALGAMAFVLYRDYARDMHEAAQQVSFVNQVSHELKTPLTNIRLYAELLEADLEAIPAADSERPRGRLNVILSEGQRLSRLIGNVLTFARQKRRTLQPQRRPVVPDELISGIIDRFRPALDELNITVETQSNACECVSLDPDFLEQILGNLISNVEKYAADGGLLRIQSAAAGEVVAIDVRDNGPGIDVARRDEVFRPFSRLSRSVSYVAGTGIGLSIARELARLHDGDLVLMNSENGCWFQVTLRCAVQPTHRG